MVESKIVIRFDVDTKQEFEMILEAASFLEDLEIKGNIVTLVGSDMVGRTPFYRLLNKKIKRKNNIISSNFVLIPKSYLLRTLFSPYDFLKFKDTAKELLNYKHEIICHGLDHPRWSYDILNETEKINWIIKSRKNFKKLFNKYPDGFAPPCFVLKNDDLKTVSKYFRYVSTISKKQKIIIYEIKKKPVLFDIPVTIAGPFSYVLNKNIKGGALPLLDYLINKGVSEKSIVKYFERLPLKILDVYYFHLMYEFKHYKKLLKMVLKVLTKNRTPTSFSEILNDVKRKKYESISYRCTL